MSNGTQTETQTETKPQTEQVVTPELKQEFNEKWQAFRRSEIGTTKKFGELAKFVANSNLSQKQVRELLTTKKSDGGPELSPESAKTEANRLINFQDPRTSNLLQEILEGKKTLTEAREQSTKKYLDTQDRANAVSSLMKEQGITQKEAEERVPQVKSKGGPSSVKSKVTPLTWPEKIESQLTAIVADVIDNGQPGQDEPWFTAMVTRKFAEIRQARVEAENKKNEANNAQEQAANAAAA